MKIEFNHHNTTARRKTIEELLSMDEYQALSAIGAISGDTSGCLFTECIMKYARYGAQVFCVGPRMREYLAATTLDGVPVDEFKLPYPAFYVAFPDSGARLWGGVGSQWHNLEGAYVMENRRDGRHVITLHFWGAENSRSVTMGDDATFYANVDIDKARSYKSMDDYVEELFTKLSDERPELRPPLGQKESAYASIRGLIHVVFNMLIYLDCVGAETDITKKRSPNRKKLERKLKKTSDGEGVKRALEADPVTTIVTLGRSVERRTIVNPEHGHRGPMPEQRVRAHWRWIPYGPRANPEYRRKRIESYKRGSDLAGVIHGRQYRVVGDDVVGDL